MSEDRGRASETLAAVLLSLAAVLTAWSSYQASRWTGEQAKAFGAASAARVESTRASALANTQTQVDILTFTEWVDAHIDGDVERATFYEERFRDEFKPAFAAWLETEPFDDPTAPSSPFAMTEYRLDATAEAEELEAAADVLATQARENVQRATNYVLAVVLSAVVLFFAGISTKLADPRLRRLILGAAVVVLVATVVWLVTSPVSISI